MSDLSTYRRILELDKALSIAADMFIAAGYVTETGNASPQAMKRWLLKRAREELRAERETKKAPDAVTSARSHEV